MSNPGDHDETPITSPSQLTDVLARGIKPRSAWRVGTEHEKFGYVLADAQDGRGPYAQPAYRPKGIEALFEAIGTDHEQWSPIKDQGAIIGLKGNGASQGASLSIEPAGQFELSGAPLKTLHDTKAEMQRHFDMIRAPADALDIGFAPLGFHPTLKRDQMVFMPKSRYAIMRRFMPKVGTRGLDMMTRTCTVQVNLDFESEEDMARKMRVSLALQPLATALFANSPFIEGRPNGYLSNRALVWTDTDNARSGMPMAFFDTQFGFEKYVEWILDVPMYFIMREGEIIDVAGASFRDWMAGHPDPRLECHRPTIGDFEDHITTAFPDVRLKQFLEMRGADAGAPEMMLAQSALWVGLLYNPSILREAENLVRRQDWSVYAQLRAEVPKGAMSASFPGGLRNLSKTVLTMAESGLKARHKGEEIYLQPLLIIADGGPTQAEKWLARYQDAWAGDVRRIFDEARV